MGGGGVRKDIFKNESGAETVGGRGGGTREGKEEGKTN